MGRAVPLLLHLPSRKGPSFSWLWGHLAAGGGSPSSAWRWYKSQRTFSLAQSAGVCRGGHWGRGGGQRPLRPRGTPPPAGSGSLMPRGPGVGLGARAFPQGPGTPPGCALARSRCRGTAAAPCLCVIWTAASPRHPHLAPPPPALLAPHLAAKPASWRRAPSLGSACEVFPGPLYVFTSFLLLCGSWEC